MPNREDITGWVIGPYEDVRGCVIGGKVSDIQIGTGSLGDHASYVEIGYVHNKRALLERPPEFRNMPLEDLGIVIPL